MVKINVELYAYMVGQKVSCVKVCSIKYLTTQIELVLPTFFQLLDRSQNYKIFNVRAIV